MAIKLQAKKRDILGKKSKNLRKEGVIPAELFGPEIDNRHISISKNDFNKVYREAGQNTVVEIEMEGETKAIPTMITEVQAHPLSREPLSVSFYMVSRDVKIETKVPLEFVGEAPAEKDGLLIVKVLDEIEVNALPQNIPHEIKVDVSKLETTKDRILVKDLDVPSDVEMITPEDMTVVTVSEKEEEEPVEEEVASPAEELAESAEKKEEEKKEEGSPEEK